MNKKFPKIDEKKITYILETLISEEYSKMEYFSGAYEVQKEEEYKEDYLFHKNKYDFLSEMVTKIYNYPGVMDGKYYGFYEPDYMFDMFAFCMKMLEYFERNALNNRFDDGFISFCAVVEIKRDIIERSLNMGD